MREMKTKVGNVEARLRQNGVVWFVVAGMFVDGTVLLAKSGRELQRALDEFHSVCLRRKLRVNAGN